MNRAYNDAVHTVGELTLKNIALEKDRSNTKTVMAKAMFELSDALDDIQEGQTGIAEAQRAITRAKQMLWEEHQRDFHYPD